MHLWKHNSVFSLQGHGVLEGLLKYLGNSFHRRSLHSHSLRHTSMKGRSRAWWTRTSERSLPSLPDGSNWNSPWHLNKERGTLHGGLAASVGFGKFRCITLIWTYCSPSRRWHPRSLLSGYTCWNWRCSLRLGIGTARLSTVWLTRTNETVGSDRGGTVEHNSNLEYQKTVGGKILSN